MSTGSFTNFTYEDVQQMRSRGCTQQDIADKLGTSRSTVSRILAAGPAVSLEAGPRLLEVDAIAKALGTVDEAVRARIGLARSIADKLDQVREQRTAASAVATANLARQYRDTLDELRPIKNSETQAIVEALRSGGPDECDAERYLATLSRIASGHDGATFPGAPEITGEQAVTLARKALYDVEEARADDGSPWNRYDAPPEGWRPGEPVPTTVPTQ